MSGPKTSHYKLTPAQRRALVAQRERMRRCGEANAFITALRAKLSALTRFPEGLSENAALLKERTGEDGGWEDKLRELTAGAEAALAGLDKVRGGKDPAALEKALERAKQEYARLLALRGELDGMAQTITDALRQNIHEGLDKAAGADFSAVAPREEKLAQELRGAISGRLTALCGAELSEELRLDIGEALSRLRSLTDEEQLRSFGALAVTPLEKRCREYIRLRSEQGAEYDRLLARYHALCEERGSAPQAVPFERGAAERLGVLCAELEAAAEHDDEQAYIARCIDEVMEDMGYRLVGKRAVTKKSGARFHSELYSFGEGTAVNVTYSPNGSITMELGAADVSDRLPEPDEAERLTEDMRGFCGKFREFGRRLLEKGVEAEHLSLLPPEPEYAQVINISDYDMTGDVGELRSGELTAPKEMTSDE